MEDISFCQCPVQGVEQVSNKSIPGLILILYPLSDNMVNQLYLQFGLFAVFDGHGGDGAARAASKLVFIM
jgi:protein phosphatase